MLSVGSLFSGVGGIDLGLERAGMRVVFQCEKDAWCRGILARRWSGVACFEDVRDVGAANLRLAGERSERQELARKGSPVDRAQAGRGSGVADHEDVGDVAGTVDVLCGGFPCQDLSVAGRRAGLSGERSGLFFEFARVADELVRPGGWIVVENVPGLLSSQGGRDFAVVVRTLGDIGFHDLAWRVLDSRYFGVPQRRRRVFIVGRRAAGVGAREVLLEPESGGGDFAPSREAGPRVAASLSRGSSGPSVSAPGRRQEDDENLVAGPLTKRYGKGINTTADDGAMVAHTLRAEGFDASEDGTGRGTPLVAGTVRSHARPGSNTSTEVLCPAPDPDGVRAPSGLPGRVDDPQPDGPRYAAMGNAVTVPVAEWIGQRIIEWELSQ